jgi:hypothetical protein
MTHGPSDAPAGAGPDSPGRPLRIGWKEHVALPDWQIRRLRVKADTGARTSVLDAASYDLREVEGVGLVARLRLALWRKNVGRLKVVEVPVLRMVVVSNSSGMREQRPLIEARICLGPVDKVIRLTVTNRASMRFRMLLGREALAGDFVVDVSEKYLQSKG